LMVVARNTVGVVAVHFPVGVGPWAWDDRVTIVAVGQDTKRPRGDGPRVLRAVGPVETAASRTLRVS